MDNKAKDWHTDIAKCPICGEQDLHLGDICSSCGWEDDRLGELFPDEDLGGPNDVSANSHRAWFMEQRKKNPKFMALGKGCKTLRQCRDGIDLEEAEHGVCPVCGKYHMKGFMDVCPECGWINDKCQRIDPSFENGPNKKSLKAAREQWNAKH